MSEPSPPPMSTVEAAGAVQDGLAVRAPYRDEKGVEKGLTDTAFVQWHSPLSSGNLLVF